MYLLPGLIDLHVHLVWDGSPDSVEQLRKESTERTLLRAVRHARETLEAGITTVRDLGSVNDLALDLAHAPPLRSEDEDEKVTLSSEELADFFRAAADAQNRFEALFIVGALAGSRPQELLGLKWPDLVLPDVPDAPGEMRLVRRISMLSEGLKVVEGLKGSKRRKRKRRTVSTYARSRRRPQGSPSTLPEGEDATCREVGRDLAREP